MPHQIGNGVSDIQLQFNLFSINGLLIGNFSKRLLIEPLSSNRSFKQNYLNHFNPKTNIDYSIPSYFSMKLIIFDIFEKEFLNLSTEYI